MGRAKKANPSPSPGCLASSASTLLDPDSALADCRATSAIVDILLIHVFFNHLKHNLVFLFIFIKQLPIQPCTLPLLVGSDACVIFSQSFQIGV